ncbi:hypothetical protein NZ698_00580 [Chryseobacterium sp. PBS4-4]|uniref:Uncharacterized protein n=1 Tax=Chryseobacterium edaphi TaxID=2976532 RepID=A0ABT2W0A4_9FLAO|nr:hypothetical protein [Chryseobacterium edaphi]MCU7615676.1 hypothetical protein [Chryseobacterium edaphi]
MATIQQIYSWFETGDIPTQEQFQQTFSSFIHREESITINKITGLESALNNKLGSNHSTDANAHNSVLAKLDASNLNYDNIQLWKTALGVGSIPDNVALVDNGESQDVYNKDQIEEKIANLNFDVTLTSDDESILIENSTKNIESNVSLFSDQFESLMTDIVVLNFSAIQILGVYDGGLKLNTNEYEIISPTRIRILSVRKYTLLPPIANVVEVQYTHLKTD